MHTILLINNEDKGIELQLKIKKDKSLERLLVDGNKLIINLDGILIVKGKDTIIKGKVETKRKTKHKVKSKPIEPDKFKDIPFDGPVPKGFKQGQTISPDTTELKVEGSQVDSIKPELEENLESIDHDSVKNKEVT